MIKTVSCTSLTVALDFFSSYHGNLTLLDIYLQNEIEEIKTKLFNSDLDGFSICVT